MDLSLKVFEFFQESTPSHLYFLHIYEVNDRMEQKKRFLTCSGSWCFLHMGSSKAFFQYALRSKYYCNDNCAYTVFLLYNSLWKQVKELEVRSGLWQSSMAKLSGKVMWQLESFLTKLFGKELWQKVMETNMWQSSMAKLFEKAQCQNPDLWRSFVAKICGKAVS